MQEATKPTCFYEYVKSFIGQKIAFTCARYHYRGTLSHVMTDSLVLANATAVEDTGPNNSQAPRTEDPFGGSICVKLDAIELCHQANWVLAKLPNEK